MNTDVLIVGLFSTPQNLYGRLEYLYMLSEAAIIATVTVVGGIIGSIITLVLTRIFNKPKDEASLAQQYQEIAKQAVDDLHTAQTASIERDKKRTDEYNKIQERLRLVEAATYGPFRITLDFTTHPLGIQNQKIELIVVNEKAPK